MARKRMIDPGIYESLQFCNLGNNRPHPQVTYLGLISSADDYGIFELDIPLLKSAIYPRSPASLVVVGRQVQAIVDEGLILTYQVDGRTFGIHPNWGEYQK